MDGKLADGAAGYIENDMAKKAVDLFTQVESPDAVIFMLVFNACAAVGSSEALKLTRSIIDRLPKAVRMDSGVQTSVIDALMKCGDIGAAETWYHEMKESYIPAHGAMMKGRSIDRFALIFDPLVSVGFVENGLGTKAIDEYRKIATPNDVITTLLFNACAQVKTKEAYDLLKKVSLTMSESFKLNPSVICSWIDALMKCGDVKSAELAFIQRKTEHLPIYGAMMKGETCFPQQSNDICAIETLW